MLRSTVSTKTRKNFSEIAKYLMKSYRANEGI